MQRSSLKPIRERPSFRTQSPIADGIGRGLLFAVGFSVLAALAMFDQAPGIPVATRLREYGIVVAFYFVAGVLGGAVFGLLRPLRDRYAGRVLTAYVILYLVYGGGTAALLPLMTDGPIPMRRLLFMWAGVCLILAPIYEWISRGPGATTTDEPPST